MICDAHFGLPQIFYEYPVYVLAPFDCCTLVILLPVPVQHVYRGQSLPLPAVRHLTMFCILKSSLALAFLVSFFIASYRMYPTPHRTAESSNKDDFYCCFEVIEGNKSAPISLVPEKTRRQFQKNLTLLTDFEKR